jgi:hypothetical protein
MRTLCGLPDPPVWNFHRRFFHRHCSSSSQLFVPENRRRPNGFCEEESDPALRVGEEKTYLAPALWRLTVRLRTEIVAFGQARQSE